MEPFPDQSTTGKTTGSYSVAKKGIYWYPLPLEGISLAKHKRKDVANRVAKIHGHVHAVREMLEEDRSYSEVVHQIVAVRSALDSVIQVIVDDLVEDCVAKAERKEPMTDSLVELQEIVAKIR